MNVEFPSERQMVGALVRDGWPSAVAEAAIATVRADATRAAEAEGLRAALDATDALPEDAPAEDTRQRLYSSGWLERGQAVRAALAAQPAPEVEPERIDP